MQSMLAGVVLLMGVATVQSGELQHAGVEPGGADERLEPIVVLASCQERVSPYSLRESSSYPVQRATYFTVQTTAQTPAEPPRGWDPANVPPSLIPPEPRQPAPRPAPLPSLAPPSSLATPAVQARNGSAVYFAPATSAAPARAYTVPTYTPPINTLPTTSALTHSAPAYSTPAWGATSGHYVLPAEPPYYSPGGQPSGWTSVARPAVSSPFLAPFPAGDARSVTALRPVLPAVDPRGELYLGRGLIGQPKVYVSGQPVRNAIRFISP